MDQVAERDGEIQRLQQQIQVRNLSIKDTSLMWALPVGPATPVEKYTRQPLKQGHLFSQDTSCGPEGACL